MKLRARHIKRPLMMAVVTVGLASCGAGEKVVDRPLQPRAGDASALKSSTIDEQSSSSSSSSSAHASKLAQQSQRDVQAFLKARQDGGAGMAGGTEVGAGDAISKIEPEQPGDDPLAKPPAPIRKHVVWKEPERKPLAAPGQTIHQPPLLRPSNIPVEPAIASGTSQPAAEPASLQPDRLKTLMVDLGRELNATAGYSDAPLRQLIPIAAMSMIDRERALNPEAFPDLTEKERELLGKLQAFFADLGKSLDSGDEDVEQSIADAVKTLRESLVEEPTLELPTLALCTRVEGFGDYTLFDRHSFLAHSEQKVIVYLEIDRFTSELNPQSEYVTELAQQLTIYSERDGIPVWKEDWQSALDVSKNQRKDFFTVQIVTLPKALSVGKYVLKVRVRDEKSQAEAEGTIGFEMVADPKLAASVLPGK